MSPLISFPASAPPPNTPRHHHHPTDPLPQWQNYPRYGQMAFLFLSTCGNSAGITCSTDHLRTITGPFPFVSPRTHCLKWWHTGNRLQVGYTQESVDSTVCERLKAKLINQMILLQSLDFFFLFSGICMSCKQWTFVGT